MAPHGTPVQAPDSTVTTEAPGSLSDSLPTITAIPKLYLSTVFPVIAHFIQEAISVSYDGLTLGDLYAQLLRDHAVLWVVMDADEPVAACITEIRKPHDVRILTIVALGGKRMQLWFGDLLSAIEQFAKLEQCQVIEAIGRKGWKRAAARFGYHDSHTVVKKEL